jgi:hypothetical protein
MSEVDLYKTLDHHFEWLESTLQGYLTYKTTQPPFSFDNLLVRIHLIMSQMFLVDRPRAMGV